MFFHLVSNKSMTLTAYLSDTNEELIKAYNVVKANDGELIEVLTEYQKGYSLAIVLSFSDVARPEICCVR